MRRLLLQEAKSDRWPNSLGSWLWWGREGGETLASHLASAVGQQNHLRRIKSQRAATTATFTYEQPDQTWAGSLSVRHRSLLCRTWLQDMLAQPQRILLQWQKHWCSSMAEVATQLAVCFKIFSLVGKISQLAIKPGHYDTDSDILHIQIEVLVKSIFLVKRRLLWALEMIKELYDSSYPSCMWTK